MAQQNLSTSFPRRGDRIVAEGVTVVRTQPHKRGKVVSWVADDGTEGVYRVSREYSFDVVREV